MHPRLVQEQISVSCCFCGRMPPKRGPLWRGEAVEEKPGGWRARCAPGRCAHMDVRSTHPGTASRSRRAGCPETAPPGVCFFGYFLCTSKESNPLAAGEWKLCTSGQSRERSKWIPAYAGMTANGKELDSGLRRNDERKELGGSSELRRHPASGPIPESAATPQRKDPTSGRRPRNVRRAPVPPWCATINTPPEFVPE